MICEVCKGTKWTGYEKPMGYPPTMVFIPQPCPNCNQSGFQHCCEGLIEQAHGCNEASIDE